MAAEVRDDVSEPTIYEQAYWDQDDARIGAAFDALTREGRPTTIAGEHFDEFVLLVWQLEVDNRLRQHELALKIGELMTAHELKSKAKRVRVPREAMPETDDAA